MTKTGWTRVMKTATTESPRLEALYPAVAACIVAAALLILPYLGDRPFWDYDEAIYARVVMDTQASGNVAALSRYGEPFFEKPPLYFWTSMGFDALLHDPQWSYRLASALAGVACVALVVLLAWEASASVPVALLAGLILTTTGPFIEASRQVRLDIPTVAAILAATYCFMRGRRDARWLVGVGIAIAIGFLFKSVIALLAGAYILAWSIIERDWRWMRERYLWLGAGFGFLILLPWHLSETVRFGGAFWDGYLWHNVISRTTSDILGGTQTFGELALYLVGYAAPWSAVFVLIVIWQLARGNPRALDRVGRTTAIFSLTAVAMLALFAASSTRIFYYLLPAYPFIAIAVALAMGSIAERIPRVASYALFLILFSAGLWVTGNYAYHRFDTMHVNDIISADEAAAGASMRHEPMDVPVFAYQHEYWDTFGYYSGGRTIAAMTDDAALSSPFFLLVSTPFMQAHSFDPELQKHLTVRYAGPVVTLYEFRP